MKLYEVPRNTRVRIIISEPPPPAGLYVEVGQEVNFKHIDGMYSYCINDSGELVHLSAWTEIEIVE